MFLSNRPYNEKFEKFSRRSMLLKSEGGPHMNAMLNKFLDESKQEGRKEGENKTLFTLVKDGLISKEEAINRSSDKKALELMFKK